MGSTMSQSAPLPTTMVCFPNPGIMRGGAGWRAGARRRSPRSALKVEGNPKDARACSGEVLYAKVDPTLASGVSVEERNVERLLESVNGYLECEESLAVTPVKTVEEHVRRVHVAAL